MQKKPFSHESRIFSQSLPLNRTFVERKLMALQVQEETRYQLVLAVDEACANSIIHHIQTKGGEFENYRTPEQQIPIDVTDYLRKNSYTTFTKLAKFSKRSVMPCVET